MDDDFSGSDIDELLADSGSEYEPSSGQSESEEESRKSSDEKGPQSEAKVKRKVKANVAGPSKKRKPAGLNGKDKRPKPRISPGAATLKFLKDMSLKKRVEKKRRLKPFENLFDDVTLVISGYQNPKRSEIRNKALEMGAKYKSDWDCSCTHLVCAFSNTPKYNQVKGQGKIVSKEWVEDCYANRTRYPWRRFAIDKYDRTQSESEEEIYDGPFKSPPRHRGQKKKTKRDASDDDTPIRARLPRQVKEEPAAEQGPSSSLTEHVVNLYDMDTDYEDEANSESLPYLPHIFGNLNFHIELLDEDQKRQVFRYITAHDGSVLGKLSSQVNYLVVEEPDRAAKFKKGLPSVICVHPEWIWRSHDEGKLLPVTQFLVKV